ncbi:YceI family protein [Roseateles sp. LKC17W]|jgi:polyisoprenoid-binding protein YceI|uniref:YceI family protein n=1 Tax=Pelomonas margarita TaxID=3299031 RepID=A0ABW7FFU1_9BURK
MKHTLLLAALFAAAGAAQAQSATYAIDPTHTQVFFEAKHFGVSTNRGRWVQKEGTVTLDKAAKTGKVDLTIDMASVSTGIGPFDGHLKSKDFFAVEQHPTAKFVGEQFTFNGDKVVSVAGTLTMLGKANPVTLTASSFGCYENPRLKREVCGGDFETTIQRSQWGMTYGLPGIPDSVRLLIQVEAIKQ